MAARPGPTLRRRKLVKELTAARTAAGMSIRQLAAEIDLQPGTLSKIEGGKQGLTVRNIKAIGRASGLSKAKIDQLVLLAADDDNNSDWLVEFREDIPEWFELYPKLEQDADEIWSYGSELPHGLVQTPAFAEVLARITFPDLADEQRRRSVDLRTARQAILEQEHPTGLKIVLNEAVIRRPIGDEEVMREQLRHLLSLSERPNIDIQVLPFSAGAHPGMKTGFNLLRFPEGFDDMDCVYLENANGSVWQERPEDVAHYSDVFTRLQVQALSGDETRDLLGSLT
ncbi:helix-turn-helix transcriptional regulator [Actinophytocola sp.]|uniref:helix-turn-helix domain-containing protein n=1 Tax=Actinophytocola sp. TaxID=1872138 RepID=UPI0025C22632|nr:helix-turn-helix transcriptional regulator [Actinophytocola sp.]